MSTSLKEWILAIVLILVIFTTVVVLLDRVVMPTYTRHNVEVEVPDIVEMPLAEAEKTLLESGFTLVVEGEKFDAHYPVGAVIGQNPASLAMTKPGRRVYVTLSSGEQMCIMPNLVGKSERDAVFSAHSSGLSLQDEDVGYEYSFYYPQGVIMAQSIPAGTKLAKDTPIHVTSSLGILPTQFTIPKLIGHPLEKARKILLTSGLEVGEITFIYRENLLPNTIIEQAPKPQEKAEKGQVVQLVVSTLDKTKVAKPKAD